MNIFEALGFQWDRTHIPNTIPVHSVDRTCFRFHRMLPEFVWDAGVLEGNPLTFVEVKTLMDGITVGGRKLSDQAPASRARQCMANLLPAASHDHELAR